MDQSAIDILDPELYLAGVPHERFTILRRDAPVYWHKEPDGPGFWAITKHQDVVAVSRDPATFSSEVRGTQIADLRRDDLRVSPNNLLNMDPPRHTRYRTLLAKGFTTQALQGMEPYIRAQMTRLIDAVSERGRCDVVTDLSGTLPLLVIFEMLGVPEADRDLLLDQVDRLLSPEDPEYAMTPEEAVALGRRLSDYAHALAVERRRSPRQDVLSLLMAAEVDGLKLTYEEFGTLFFMLLAAGSDTTRNLISNGLLTLIEHPDERRQLADNPWMLPSAIEEMLRIHPSVIHFRRTATCDTELRGQRIAEGDKVVVWYVSANRDEEVFPDPHAFIPDRKPNNHLAFGYGPHFCIGSVLARMEARIGFEEILRRLPDLSLDGPVERIRTNLLNKPRRMPVRFTPR